MLHLDQRSKLICKHEVGILSRAMRQMLLPHVGGGSYLVSMIHGGGGVLVGCVFV